MLNLKGSLPIIRMLKECDDELSIFVVRVKSLKLFVIFSACNLLIPSAWAEDACGVVTTACPTLNIPYSPQEGVVGTIGNGFDSDRDRYKPMRCLNGTETAIGGGVSTLAATKISSTPNRR